MFMAPRRFILVAAVLVGLLPLLFFDTSFSIGPWIAPRPLVTHILPVPSKTYVISLPRRTDRREQMEHLRTRLGVEWSYFDAGEADAPLVTKIVDQVHAVRKNALFQTFGGLPAGDERVVLPFAWPEANASISWTSFEDREFPVPPSWVGNLYEDNVDLTVSRDDFTLTRFKAGMHPFEYMSRGPVACYHSHLSLIYETAKRELIGEPSLILEDDVDIDADIQEQLRAVWHLLPTDWDMVFLGFCWANEMKYPGMDAGIPLDGSTAPRIRFFPSNQPLCSHAYAISPIGARRLLRFLSHPPFAYSRPIDQSFKYLISHGLIQKAFTVIPSVVTQYRLDGYESDVIKLDMPDTWNWSLKYGVLASEGAKGEQT